MTTLKDRIENTEAFKSFDKFQQSLIRKRSVRIQIEDAYKLCKNIGLAKYQSQTPTNRYQHALLLELLTEDAANESK
jgi:hypothetical protein